MSVRIIYLLILILVALWLPWWALVIFGLAGIVRYSRFYEIILPALLFDFLYSGVGVTPLRFPLMFSVFALLAVYLAEEIRPLIIIPARL